MEQKKSRIFTVIAFIVLIVLGYTSMSANCATGGDCTFSSGGWGNWLLGYIHELLVG